MSSEDDAPEPTLRRYIANDTNVASLGVLLQQNTNGLLVFRDELVSLLAHLDQEKNASERGFYLTAWSGKSSYTFDRIGRGLHLHIDAPGLSMLGSTQPGIISQYLSRAVRGGRGDDGLIQRFGLSGMARRFFLRGATLTVYPIKMRELPHLRFSKIWDGSKIGTPLPLSGIVVLTVTRMDCRISGSDRTQTIGLSNGGLIWKSGCAAVICIPRWDPIWQNIASSCLD